MVTDHKKSYVGGEDGGESYACMILFQLHLVCVYGSILLNSTANIKPR